MKKTFGPMVTAIREEKGLLLQDLADSLPDRKSVAYLSQIERQSSQTMPGAEIGRAIIKALKVDAATRARLEQALKHDLESHQVERLFPSSNLLETFFTDTRMSVAAIAANLIEDGKPRSRQIVQVWKNGVQLPTPQAAKALMAEFRKVGITEEAANAYLRAHLHDSVFYSKDLAHLTAPQRQRIADCAVSTVFGVPAGAKN